MKRFSNTPSVSTLEPVATDSTAMIWACMSVGNPGKGAVSTRTPRCASSARMRTRVGSTSSSAPTSRNLSIVDSSMEVSIPVTWTSPRVIMPAASRVPASIRSPETTWRMPRRDPTPRIAIRSPPAPRTDAPIALSESASSSTSGSRAAFSRIVSPRARTAAIIVFWVPLTVTRSNTIRAPRSPVLDTST